MSRAGILLIVSISLLLVWGGMAAGSDAREPTAKQTEAKGLAPKTETPSKRGKRAAKGRRSPVDRVWWNHPRMIEEIGLSDEQRQRMNAIFEESLEIRKGETSKQKTSLEAFGKALAGGDPAEIAGREETLFETMAKPLREQISMIAKVYAELSAEQRQALAARHPNVLFELWDLSSNPRSPKKGRKPRRK